MGLTLAETQSKDVKDRKDEKDNKDTEGDLRSAFFWSFWSL